MHPVIESLFDGAENGYIPSETLAEVNQYMKSLPERLAAYRTLRDREIQVMQKVADELEKQLTGESVERLEQSLKTGILAIRHCAMAMLMQDDRYLEERLLSWLEETTQIYNTQSIDRILYPLIRDHLGQLLNANQMRLLEPFLAKVQHHCGASEEDSLLTVAGIF
ncbi:hypothetical protein [Alkalinema sp. FACHB-956]|uniref:hypothetical protein n=1 Tax=Alkalinema sp. FACHB-956 TaxID=2692768 RepID=UPI001689EA66|nr:hypothetical protein [Alkalinema sp. FACHB-956]MBD2327456.1 hypothetical protein [Alkalinema sp. FACHB-956]